MEVWLFDGARGLSTLTSKKVRWEKLPQKWQKPSVAMSRLAPSSMIAEARFNVSLESAVFVGLEENVALVAWREDWLRIQSGWTG